VGLAYIAAGDGDHDDALALLKEAGAIAEASGAHRITRQVEESRAQLVARNRAHLQVFPWGFIPGQGGYLPGSGYDRRLASLASDVLFN